MNQALYAHMNNKRKMKKKKTEPDTGLSFFFFLKRIHGLKLVAGKGGSLWSNGP
jgi:hypothetical protein